MVRRTERAGERTMIGAPVSAYVTPRALSSKKVHGAEKKFATSTVAPAPVRPFGMSGGYRGGARSPQSDRNPMRRASPSNSSRLKNEITSWPVPFVRPGRISTRVPRCSDRRRSRSRVWASRGGDGWDPAAGAVRSARIRRSRSRTDQPARAASWALRRRRSRLVIANNARPWPIDRAPLRRASVVNSSRSSRRR